MIRPLTAAVLIASLTLSLGGCVNVLPKTKPVQMYRFGYTGGGGNDQTGAYGMAPKGIVLGNVSLPQDSAGDRITTTESNEVAYVGGARWTAPAEELFNEAISEGFARTARGVRLESRGSSAAGYRLDVTVRRFESVYTRGKPTVTIDMDARIIRLSDKVIVGDRFISSAIALKHSDMSDMAAAYDQATTESISALIDFAQQTMGTQEGVDTPSADQPSDGKQKVEGL